MTVVITIKASDNAKNRYRARRAEKREQQKADEQLARKIAAAHAGCSTKVVKATALPSLRDRNEGGAVCLPAVAIYSAGFRKVRKEATHIIK